MVSWDRLNHGEFNQLCKFLWENFEFGAVVNYYAVWEKYFDNFFVGHEKFSKKYLITVGGY
jgi:hypothetical protein